MSPDLSEVRAAAARTLPADHPVRIGIESSPPQVSVETYDALTKAWVRILFEEKKRGGPP